MSRRPRLARIAVTLPHRRRTIRLRLTLIYCGLFLACGACLLVITYVLVRFTFPAGSTHTYLHPSRGSGSPGPLPSLATLRAQTARQRDADLHQLLLVSAGALAGMVLVSLALGWIVAGRVLRPLRTIMTATRDLSSATLDRRLALPGPDDEIKELGDTIDELLDRLERSFAAQRLFVANASHELRTPLTLERALLEAALANPDASGATLRKTCERLLGVNADQERMIEALLTLATSERGIDRPEPLDLAETAARVLDFHRNEAEHLGLRVDAVLAPAATHGDPDLIERLVANLLDNAVRYNRRGGLVEVTTETDAGCAAITVHNTGPPVPPDRVDELFQPFRRLGPNRTRQPGTTGHRAGGHGLGLSIVAAVASAHGADLTAQPGVHGGLSVTVRFPAGDPGRPPC
jgi:signal transduction histidine kinase